MSKSSEQRSYLREWAKLLVGSYSSFIALAALFLELSKAIRWFGESSKIWITIAGGLVGLLISILFARENFRRAARRDEKESRVEQ